MALDEPAQQLFIEQLQRDIRRLDGKIDNLQTTLIVSPTNELRELDIPFTISNDNYTLVIYTIELEVTFSLVSTQEITVDLLSDAENPPTTSQGNVKLEGDQGLGLSVTTTIKQRQQLVALIPPGNHLLLQTSGTGIATIINQLELVLNG